MARVFFGTIICDDSRCLLIKRSDPPINIHITTWTPTISSGKVFYSHGATIDQFVETNCTGGAKIAIAYSPIMAWGLTCPTGGLAHGISTPRCFNK
jgi:hypothetical protein